MGKDALLAIRREIQAEQAASLGRCGRKLQRALRLCARLERDIRAAEERLARPAVPAGFNGYVEPREEQQRRLRRLIERFNASQAEAARQHYYLIVQREAIGFRSHREVEHCYEVPSPRASRFLDTAPAPDLVSPVAS
ncbi:MAG: hypothetical protein HYY96_09045 [Candidatus Tectomicrobia bacterium]|nr:hypothetical protein [Candidatus Tectomicrobia bacterium]